jgi:hypothetical protein
VCKHRRTAQHYPEILSLSGTTGQRRETHDREVFHAADLTTKEQMLAKVAPAGQSAHRFKADDTLLRFLSSL